MKRMLTTTHYAVCFDLCVGLCIKHTYFLGVSIGPFICQPVCHMNSSDSFKSNKRNKFCDVEVEILFYVYTFTCQMRRTIGDAVD